MNVQFRGELNKFEIISLDNVTWNKKDLILGAVPTEVEIEFAFGFIKYIELDNVPEDFTDLTVEWGKPLIVGFA